MVVHDLMIAFLVLVLIYHIYLLGRTIRVNNLRKNLLDLCSNDPERLRNQLKVFNRYTYMQMWLSNRSIHSYTRELVNDINKVELK